MIPLDLIAMLLFFFLIGIRLFFRRRELKFEYGIILEKWKGGLEWIDEAIRKHGKLINYIEIVSVLVAAVLSIAGIGFILYSVLKAQQTMAIVLPSVAGIKYPGPVISIPFWYWLIILFIVAFPHETAHALFAKKEGIKISSYGIVYFLVLPIGAFVEPSKKQLENAEWKSKLKVFSAGSFSNLVIAALFFLLLFLSTQSFNYLVKPIGISFTTIENTPAHAANLSGIMLRIDNTTISNVYDLANFLNKTKPGEVVTVYTTEGTYRLALAEKEGRSFMGITNISTVYTYKHLFKGTVPEKALMVFAYWTQFLFWGFALSLGVATANMLPAKPLDGGLFYEELFRLKFGRKKAKKISNSLSVAIWLLILLSLGLFRTR